MLLLGIRPASKCNIVVSSRRVSAPWDSAFFASLGAPFYVHSLKFIARLVGFSRCQRACRVGCRSPCSFRSIGRDGLWTTRSFLYIRPAHLCNAVASSRKHQESTSGPKGIAGPTGSLCLFRCMCGRVASQRFAHHAKSSARGAMRRALGHEDRLLRSALTSHRRLQRRLSWFSCPSGPAFNWSGLHSH